MSSFTWLARSTACSNWRGLNRKVESQAGLCGAGVGRPVGSLLRRERAGAVNTGGKAEKEETRKV